MASPLGRRVLGWIALVLVSDLLDRAVARLDQPWRLVGVVAATLVAGASGIL